MPIPEAPPHGAVSEAAPRAPCPLRPAPSSCAFQCLPVGVGGAAVTHQSYKSWRRLAEEVVKEDAFLREGRRGRVAWRGGLSILRGINSLCTSNAVVLCPSTPPSLRPSLNSVPAPHASPHLCLPPPHMSSSSMQVLSFPVHARVSPPRTHLWKKRSVPM